ncbi:MAG: tetratricopeptide repeat protein, partial [Pirellulaceae bacterium]
DQVVANPQLLRDLDLSIDESVDKLDYPITAEMLDRVTALVVAEPESISSRMLDVENSLTGDVRLKLIFDVDSQADQFRDFSEIDDVKLWHTPFSTQMFREIVEQARITATYDQDIRSRIRPLVSEEEYIDRFVMLRTARNTFLRGIYQSDRNRKIRSAFSYYYGFMYTDQQIRELDEDKTLQMSLGILKDVDQDFNDWRMQLEGMKASMGRVRADASFYMGMSHYENGYPDSSLKWLERVGDFDDDGRWAEHTPYHEGRAYEASGEYDDAAVSYGQDQSAQRHGSLIRKRWMEQLKRDAATGS